MVGNLIGFNAAALLFWGMGGTSHWADLKELIDNDTREFASGSDYLRTEVNFQQMETGLAMIHTESHIVRGTGHAAMKETRHVPLKNVRKIAVLQGGSEPGEVRRYLVLIQYRTEATKVYLQQTGEHEAFATQQAFTLGTYTETRAEQILAGLKGLCLQAGAILE